MSDNIFNAKRFHATVGGKEIMIETGRLANQADGAIWIQCGGTVVLVTAQSQKLEREVSFFPLVVDYQEKMYAAGRIPGSFFRREIGRPGERETLISRLIDRPIRPLFPNGYRNEVQVLATVISADQENESDVLALTGASAALSISSIPFEGPVAGARIGRINGEFVLNPGSSEMAESDLDIIVAATREAIVMVEGKAEFIPEDVIAAALDWGFKEIQPLIDLQEEMAKALGRVKQEVVAPTENEALKAKVEALAKDGLSAAMQVVEKMARKEAKSAVKEKVMAALAEDPEYAEGSGNEDELKKVGDILDSLTKKIVRARIQKEGLRIDGRDTRTVRNITIEPALLPRAHGSVLFARGETKSLVVATLGSTRDEQRVDTLMGDDTKRFMLHYNFPPYCVGEVKMIRVSRREIGHGALAEKAIAPILPKSEEFPFTIRVVSEIMESNGSSSMASVCGASLALMDAGVPVKCPIAGIAMGLIKEDDDYLVLTDILGDEDALGDMDFKIAGSAEGVTAVQMDIKISGIPAEVMAKALAQAREARLHILGEMNKVLAESRPELSKYAPQMEIVEINPDKIRSVIGPGGKMIKQITAESGADIEIDDSGKIMIFAPDQDSMNKAKEMVLFFDQRPEVGKTYEGKVTKVLDCGLIVEILPGVEALCHISQLDIGRVENAESVAKLGGDLKVKVLELLPEGRIRVSRAAVLFEERGETPPEGFFDGPGGGNKRSGDRGDRGGRRDDRGGRRDDRGGRRDDRGGRRDDRGGRRDDRGGRGGRGDRD